MRTTNAWLLIGGVLLISLVSACYAADVGRKREPVLTSATQELSIRAGKLTRNYLLHLPPAVSQSKPLPVVFALHGGGGTGEGMMETTSLNEKADKEGFIAIYPDGTGRKLLGRKGFYTWNSGDCCGEAHAENVDDVEFIRALLNSLQTTLPVDPKRIYVAGLSNGGSMAYRLGCELSDRIAGIAVVAGDFNLTGCRPANPVPVIVFHGTADDHVPYAGGVGERSLVKLSRKPVSFAVSFWVKHNGAATVPQKEEHGSIVKETYGKGKDDAEVILYTIKGGGHAWPGGVKGRWKGAPEPTREISATDRMWEFFARHPKK